MNTPSILLTPSLPTPPPVEKNFLGITWNDSIHAGHRPNVAEPYRMTQRLTEYERGKLLEHLAELAEEFPTDELVADLVNGSRATFTIAEAARFLSVSPKHLYALAAASDHIAPSVEVLRSGDRMVVPAHQLRRHLGLPDPHGLAAEHESATIERFSPAILAAIADFVSFTVLLRLEESGLIELPPIVEESRE